MLIVQKFTHEHTGFFSIVTELGILRGWSLKTEIYFEKRYLSIECLILDVVGPVTHKA